MAAPQLPHPGKSAVPRRPGGGQGQHLLPALGVRLRREPRVGEQRFWLAAEHQRGALKGIKQRLDAHPVPGQQQGAAAPVPEGKGENALQLLHRRRPEQDALPQQHLRVRPGLQRHAPLLQLPAQLGGVVELPVVAQGTLAPGQGAHHGLTAVLRVDDRQPPVGEGACAALPHPVVVRPAPPERLPHGKGRLAPLRRPVIPPKLTKSRNAAHGSASS